MKINEFKNGLVIKLDTVSLKLMIFKHFQMIQVGKRTVICHLLQYYIYFLHKHVSKSIYHKHSVLLEQ